MIIPLGSRSQITASVESGQESVCVRMGLIFCSMPVLMALLVLCSCTARPEQPVAVGIMVRPTNRGEWPEWKAMLDSGVHLYAGLQQGKDREDQVSITVRLSVGDYTESGPGKTEKLSNTWKVTRMSFVPPASCLVEATSKGNWVAVRREKLSWGAYALSIREEHFITIATFPAMDLDAETSIRIRFHDDNGVPLFTLMPR